MFVIALRGNTLLRLTWRLQSHPHSTLKHILNLSHPRGFGFLAQFVGMGSHSILPQNLTPLNPMPDEKVSCVFTHAITRFSCTLQGEAALSGWRECSGGESETREVE